MEGNCKIARPGFGKNEMYPCIDKNVTYGLAVTGLAVTGTVGKTSIEVDFRYEPNVRTGEMPVDVQANVTVTGLAPDGKYTLLRYVGTEALPQGPPFGLAHWSTSIQADAKGKAYVSRTPAFKSNQAVYHITIAAEDYPHPHHERSQN